MTAVENDETVLVDFLAPVRVSGSGFSPRSFQKGDRARVPAKAIEFWIYNGKALRVEPGTPLMEEDSSKNPPDKGTTLPAPPDLSAVSSVWREREESERLAMKNRFVEMMRVASSVEELAVCTEAIDPTRFSEEDLAGMWDIYVKEKIRLKGGTEKTLPSPF